MKTSRPASPYRLTASKGWWRGSSEGEPHPYYGFDGRFGKGGSLVAPKASQASLNRNPLGFKKKRPYSAPIGWAPGLANECRKLTKSDLISILWGDDRRAMRALAVRVASGLLFLLLLSTFWLGPEAAQAGAKLSVANDARLAGDRERTRFIVDLSKKVDIHVFSLDDPYRVICLLYTSPSPRD